MHPALRVIDAAYRTAASPDEWLTSVAESVADALEAPAGGVAYFVDWRPDGMPTTSAWTRVGGASEDLLVYTREQHGGQGISAEQAAAISHVYSRGSYLSGTRELMGQVFEELERVRGSFRERTGDSDSLNLIAMDATHRGVAFVHPLPYTVRTRSARRARWAKVAAHLSSGLRMLRASGPSPIASADAILDTSGRVLHATLGTRDDFDRLRHAARDVDKARLRHTGEDEALDLWQCLFSGEYSVVDRFDTDGKRLFVAKRNSPEARGPRVLTQRERQVVALVAVGHADKSVAYELGIATGTVAAHLHAALAKLGLTETSDLGLLKATLDAHERLDQENDDDGAARR
jgi:DNA-binding CsgD family transcriptional regulator